MIQQNKMRHLKKHTMRRWQSEITHDFKKYIVFRCESKITYHDLNNIRCVDVKVKLHMLEKHTMCRCESKITYDLKHIRCVDVKGKSRVA